jgi:nucleoside-diphosphate-sugar epimerase
MLIALTGATGFLGSYTAAALRRAGHRVRALFRSSGPRGRREVSVDEWQVGDQYDPHAQAELVAGVDAVVQVAIDWAALNQGPIPNWERNLLGSLRLLEASRSAGARQFLFVSSMDIYHEILPHRRLDETDAAWPGSVYGAYKAAVEIHVKAYHAAYGMNASAWRPATMYGLNPKLEQSLWFDLVKAVKQGETVSADAHAQVVAVEDVAEALALAVGNESVKGQFYNLVDCVMDWQEVAAIARELTASTAIIRDSRDRGFEPRFDASKAIAFFNAHGNTTALRRGRSGVQAYIASLLADRPPADGSEPMEPRGGSLR